MRRGSSTCGEVGCQSGHSADAPAPLPPSSASHDSLVLICAVLWIFITRIFRQTAGHSRYAQPKKVRAAIQPSQPGSQFQPWGSSLVLVVRFQILWLSLK